MQFETQIIHAGQSSELTTGAVIPPIFMTSTYAQAEPGITQGYDYTRAGNPNFSALEQTLAAIEQGQHATVFSSGLGAITAVASTLVSGDVVLASADLYGGTYRLFQKVFNKFGVHLELVDTTALNNFTTALQLKPKLVLIESPTNPLLHVSNIEALAKLAKAAGATVVVDNTFATPYYQTPLTFGADLVLHSTTKYISGHSDIIGGAVITFSVDWKAKMDFARMALGLNPSPFDVWLTSRGLKTLALRMVRHTYNAQTIAVWLKQQPSVKQVHYPGFSGVVSVEFNFTLSQTKGFLGALRLFTLAESLGGVESLIDHPASMTHASLSAEQQITNGINDGLVRISVGIEAIEDLLSDLEQAIYVAQNA